MLNPLIDRIFDLILTQKVWQVHILAAELINCGAIKPLDKNPERDLFKRNFLIMNALYQLQEQLHPKSLLISTLHIELIETDIESPATVKSNLKDYYLDWGNYEASEEQINELLTSFWQKFKKVNSAPALTEDHFDALLAKWQLTNDFSLKELQKRWRQLALAHHPDKPTGCENAFKQIKVEYEQLKQAARS